MFLSQFSLASEDALGHSWGLCIHWHNHASVLWSVSIAICLPSTSNWHWGLSFLLWGRSALIPSLMLSAPVVPEEVLLHLDIDHFSDVLLVKLNVSNILISVVDEVLLSRNFLLCLDIEGIRFARLPEDALQVVLEVLDFEFVYWVTVLILEIIVRLLRQAYSLHSNFIRVFLM